MNPIGVFHSSQVEPYEAGRQPDDMHADGVIELTAGNNFEQALTGLEGCERIWVIFLFHHNPNWNPMVLPPRGGNHKVGVFATRSPYRPNSIGMSCVKVSRIDKLKIFVSGADLLDGSPILDIKPYIAYADSFPGVEPAWLKNTLRHQVVLSDQVIKHLEFLEEAGLSQLRGFLSHQLEYEPTNSKKKRVKMQGDHFVIAYRTWRASFRVIEQTVEVLNLSSGYSIDDLAMNEDPYNDKDLHRRFKTLFPVGD
ncbi:MAG: tRNA (N6-threonylcarbamoyladenosine(37)-N6)-methyltransferase TrmO [Bdellovibrio sp.]|nr:tRNA (N6-threonylcarbamoyladenosine(37)-N6)-methyltransferase TrmO [Bdellovibrio sp.]